MAYYYLTKDNKIFKSVGARFVREILQKNKAFLDICAILEAEIAKEVAKEIDRVIINRMMSIATKATNTPPQFNARNIMQKNIYDYGIDVAVNKNRTKIPIQKFKQQNKIMVESKHFYDIIFAKAVEIL